MMELNHKQVPLVVKFKHLIKSGKTQCHIVYKQNRNKLVAYGESILSEKDQYNRVIGRKISFSRALNNLTDDKEERTRFWKEYKEHCRIEAKKQ